jgi:hypothetical protein
VIDFRTLKIKTFFIFVTVCGLSGGSGMAAEINYEKTIKNIAQKIDALKEKFPQLKEFSPSKNTDLEGLRITYDYHTHQAKHRGGWTSGVPNPDGDGIWFYIDLHDPDSKSQIHTQPFVGRMYLGNKIAFLLILEGENTAPLESSLWKILEEVGAKPREKRISTPD